MRSNRSKRIYTKNTCRSHFKPLPCQSCVHSKIANRLTWQKESVRQAHREAATKRDMSWFDDEELIVRSHAGFLHTGEITNLINAIRDKYHLPHRRSDSISTWAHSHELNLHPHRSVYSLERTINTIGVTISTMRWWRKLGYLTGRSWGKFWVFDESELIDFVQTKPWLVDADRIQPGIVQQMAEMANRRDPWLRTNDLAKLVPVRPATVINLIHEGVIEAKKRPGHNRPYMIKASTVPAIRDALATRKFVHRHLIFYARWGSSLAA